MGGPVGVGLQVFGALGAYSGQRAQAGLTRMQAIQAGMAADFADADAVMKKRISDSNVAIQNAYAEYLLGTGEVNVKDIDAKIARNIKIVSEQTTAEMAHMSGSAAARGISINSESSLNNLENIQTESEKYISDIQYQGNVETTHSIMDAQNQYTRAKQTAYQEKMSGIMDETQSRSRAISQRANSQVMMETSRYQKDQAFRGVVLKSASAFTTLLGSPDGFAAKFA